MKHGVILILVLTLFSASAQVTLSTKNKKAIELYTEADNFRVRLQYREALELLNQAIDKDPNFSEAYFRKALIYKSLRDYTKSNELYLKG
ncbi:MAG: tetratricopeptide repeat protein [Bacteroidota bacterium]